MTGLTVAGQLRELFLSAGLGFFLGVWYSVFTVWRLFRPPSAWTVWIQDLLFFLTAAPATFLFLLAVSDGELRFYLLAGIGIGFLAFHFTLGKWLCRAAACVIRVFLSVWSAFWRTLFRPLKAVGKRLLLPARRGWAFLYNRSKKIFKKFCKFRKKDLQE